MFRSTLFGLVMIMLQFLLPYNADSYHAPLNSKMHPRTPSHLPILACLPKSEQCAKLGIMRSLPNPNSSAQNAKSKSKSNNFCQKRQHTFLQSRSSQSTVHTEVRDQIPDFHPRIPHFAASQVTAIYFCKPYSSFGTDSEKRVRRGAGYPLRLASMLDTRHAIRVRALCG